MFSELTLHSSFQGATTGASPGSITTTLPMSHPRGDFATLEFIDTEGADDRPR